MKSNYTRIIANLIFAGALQQAHSCLSAVHWQLLDCLHTKCQRIRDICLT